MHHLYDTISSSCLKGQELDHRSNVNPVLLLVVPNFQTMPSKVKPTMNGVNQEEVLEGILELGHV